MADALASGSSSAPSFLKCAKCLNDAVDPVLTSCYHTICRKCHDVVVKESGEEGVFKCPFCGCNGSAGSSPLLSFNGFVNLVRETFAAFVRDCSICKKKGLGPVMKAVKVCMDCPCDQFLCQACSEQHSFFPILSSHSLIPVEDYVEGTERNNQSEEMCAVHPTKSVDVVCSTCGLRMCVVCTMTKPCPRAVSPLTAHTIVDKEDMKAALKRDIQKVCEKCSVNVAEIDRLMEAAQDEVLTATADAEMALEKLDEHRVAVREEWKRTEGHMNEMKSQLKASHQARIDECKGMVKKLEYVRQMNERGKVLGERAVCKAPKEDLGSLLAEVHQYQMSSPSVTPPNSSVLVFMGPDLVEIKKRMESVGGSLIDNSLYPPVINHSVLPGTEPHDCHRMGSSLIEANYTMRQLCVVDEEGVRRVIHSGDTFTGTCSTSDGAQLLAVAHNSNRLYTFSSDSSDSFKLKTKLTLPDFSSTWGVSMSSSGLVSVMDHKALCIRVLDSSGQVVKSLGPSSVGGVKALGNLFHSVWSPDEKSLYVTNYSGSGVAPASVVVCINMSTDTVQWMTRVSDPYTINLVRGELYVTQFVGSNVTVLDPKDGSILRTHECPGSARGVYADGPSKVTIVSYTK